MLPISTHQRSTSVIKISAAGKDKIGSMDLKRLVSQFAYHIEQKPDGGFIAFHDVPDLLTIIGIALVIAAGAYVVRGTGSR